MRTLAQKTKTTKQTTCTKTTKPSRSFLGHSRDVQSILHLQRTFGNQAVLRLLQTPRESVDASSGNNASTGFAQDFSQIPVQATALSNITPKLKVNAPRDQCEQKADWVADQVLRQKMPVEEKYLNVDIQARASQQSAAGEREVASDMGANFADVPVVGGESDGELAKQGGGSSGTACPTLVSISTRVAAPTVPRVSRPMPPRIGGVSNAPRYVWEHLGSWCCDDRRCTCASQVHRRVGVRPDGAVNEPSPHTDGRNRAVYDRYVPSRRRHRAVEGVRRIGHRSRQSQYDQRRLPLRAPQRHAAYDRRQRQRLVQDFPTVEGRWPDSAPADSKRHLELERRHVTHRHRRRLYVSMGCGYGLVRHDVPGRRLYRHAAAKPPHPKPVVDDLRLVAGSNKRQTTISNRIYRKIMHICKGR